MPEFFDINEELKEVLIRDHGAFFAKTEFFKEGFLVINPESFYETIVLWKPGTDKEVLKKALRVIKEYSNKIDKVSFITDVIFEYNNKHPAFLWAIFPEDIIDK